jgi:hypothetical protein
VTQATTEQHTYTVIVYASVDAADNVEALSNSVEVDLTVTNPCLQSSALIVSQTIADTTYVIEAATSTITFTAFTDIVSNTYTGSDLCGTKSYELYAVTEEEPYVDDLFPWFTNRLDGDASVFEFDINYSVYNADIMDIWHQFYVKVWLDDYYVSNWEYATHFEPFRVMLTASCTTASLTAPAVSNLVYEVFYPAETVSVAAFTETCGFTVTYTD